MRRRARTDANQQHIVAMLRACGASVFPTHQVGRGFPDIVVGWQGDNYLLEIKDGDKPPSKRALTPDEEEFISAWRGQVAVVESADDALRVIGATE